MLQPIKLQPEEAPGIPDAPIVTCENPTCGKQEQTHNMINFTFFVGSPGDHRLSFLQCPANQGPQALGHWACSINCWLTIAHACIDEHGHAMLINAHQTLQTLE